MGLGNKYKTFKNPLKNQNETKQNKNFKNHCISCMAAQKNIIAAIS